MADQKFIKSRQLHQNVKKQIFACGIGELNFRRMTNLQPCLEVPKLVKPINIHPFVKKGLKLVSTEHHSKLNVILMPDGAFHKFVHNVVQATGALEIIT